MKKKILLAVVIVILLWLILGYFLIPRDQAPGPENNIDKLARELQTQQQDFYIYLPSSIPKELHAIFPKEMPSILWLSDSREIPQLQIEYYPTKWKEHFKQKPSSEEIVSDKFKGWKESTNGKTSLYIEMDDTIVIFNHTITSEKIYNYDELLKIAESLYKP